MIVMDENDKEAIKKNKQRRKMTKILSKAWNFESASPFRQDKLSSTSSQPLDLQIIGQKLDEGGYENGRRGWEMFARDLGGVYHRHILSNSKTISINAKKHLQGVIDLLSELDEKFGDIASKAPPPVVSHQTPSKATVTTKTTNTKHTSKGLVTTTTTTTTTSASSEVKGLSVGGSGTGKRPPAGNKVRQSNQRTSDAERKRLKKELDKLMKAHKRASKALDDFRNDKVESRYPIEDELLEPPQSQQIAKLLQVSPDFCSVPGFSNCCIPDILIAWDFLCTFSRSLSLDAIGLDDFVAALNYTVHKDCSNDSDEKKSFDKPSDVPLYLAEAHIALLRLLLHDESSNLWWWCTIYTEADEEENGGGGTNGESKASSKKRKRDKDEINFTEENVVPVVKINMNALLNVKEDPELTILWIQALESARSVRANQGAPLKGAVKNALAITTNEYVKTYLKKSMKMFRKNSAGFTKRAVIWLVDKVREARPDLWGQNISSDVIASQIAKVSADASRAFEQMEEEIFAPTANDESDMDNGSDHDEAMSDEEEESDDEDILSQEDNEMHLESHDHETKKSKGEVEVDADTCPVTSAVPSALAPTLVDILLPPSKPSPSSNILSPFTWPCLAGAACRRILHHFKRKRNQVDDEIRLGKQLPPLTRSQRKQRELLISQRIFPGCATDPSGRNDDIMESAIEHLCTGFSYMVLTSVQKLCILRVLIEAAYDSYHISKCVDGNIKDRANAVKALEAEERKAKREARDEAATADRSARERLAAEARSLLLAKKRREIKRLNRRNLEYTNEFIDEMTEDDVLKIDEDSKAEFDALPLPESFSKVEVSAMVTKMQEEDAFETDALIVLTMEEIVSREQEALETLKEELATYGSSTKDMYSHRIDRETSAKIDRLKKDITNLECDILTLPAVRARACDELLEAIEDGTVKALRTAIKNAKLASLTGQDDKTSSVWTLDILRDASLELRSAEKRRKVTEAKKELVERRNRCFVRTEPIGRDRFRNRYWHFSYDYSGRLWAEQSYNISLQDPPTEMTPDENDILPHSLRDSEIEATDFMAFSRMEYHGCNASLSRLRWGGYTTDKSLRSLIKCLDERGARESALKANLKECIESRVAASDKTEGQVDQGNRCSSLHDVNNIAKSDESMQTGDEMSFAKALHLFQQDTSRIVSGMELLDDVSSAINKRVRIRSNERMINSGDGEIIACYDMGTVISWCKAYGRDEESEGDQWRIALDRGGEMDLSALEVVDGLLRALKWARLHENYVEVDAPFLHYRNKLGKFCGKASEAPFSATAQAFSRLMVKREAELYNSLKYRSYENNWGGKAGARNLWIQSLRDSADDFDSLRNGLIMLESGFYELITGDSTPFMDEDVIINTRNMLSTPESRFDIELESVGCDAAGLWNSQETRSIFLEITQSTNSIGFLALALDLLCRNCKAYLDKVSVSSRWTSTITNEIQDSHAVNGNGWGVITSKRRAAAQVSYEHFFT